MKKCKCKNDLFTIQVIPCCDNCSENGAYDQEADKGDGDYVYDERIIVANGLIRDQVEHNGECAYGPTAGNGCWMFTCSRCGHKFNLYIADC